METQEAVKIMQALAAGVNPETQEALAQDSLYRTPSVVIALNRALTTLVKAEERERNRPANAGKSWSREEDTQVCDELQRGIDFQEIAKSHSRSVGSIVARLVKLGKITAPGPKAA